MKQKVVVNSEYRFIRCLGEGLSSTVYEALRSNSSGISDERVAVKVLKSENSVSWLQNEFKSLRRVNSPNCVRVLGHESFQEGPALILEYIDGVTLFDLGQKFQLSSKEISEIVLQTKNGLSDIDSFGLSHGDLNPKNILIDRSGLVRLIDFGSFKDDSSLIGSLPYISYRSWEREVPSLASDLQSLVLIIEDLKNGFKDIPLHIESAKSRAVHYKDKTLSVELERVALAREKISEKVNALLASRAEFVQTQVLTPPSYQKSPFRSLGAAMFVAFLLFPVPALLSKPIQPAEPATLLIRTAQWTRITINGVTKGYAPMSFGRLKPGVYKIQYERQRDRGEIKFFLNPGQKRLLKDADFTSAHAGLR